MVYCIFQLIINDETKVLPSTVQPQHTKSDKLTVQFQARCLSEERLIRSKALFVLLLLAGLCILAQAASSLWLIFFFFFLNQQDKC